MNITGLDSLVFGVDDVEACNQYLTDYGLSPKDVSAAGGTFEALDGTSVVIRHKDDPSLPPALPTGSMLRKTIHGVADQATLSAIAEELGKDRDVRHLDDGSIEAEDDMGFTLGFQLSIRQPISIPAEKINAPGDEPGRPVNAIGADESVEIKLRSLSHVVYFVPDSKKAEKFYIERLGFRVAVNGHLF